MAGEYRKAYVKRKKGGIHIKPSHEGRFTAKHISVAEGLSEGGNTAKQANFARMARRHWKPL